MTEIGPRSPRFLNSYRRRPCVLSNFFKLLGQASPPLVPSAEIAKAPSLREDNGFSEHLAQLTRFNCSFLIPSRDFGPLSSRAAARVQGGLPSLGAQTTKLLALPADAPPAALPPMGAWPDLGCRGSAEPPRSRNLVPRDWPIQVPQAQEAKQEEEPLQKGEGSVFGRNRPGEGRGELDEPASSARL